jgi:DNA-binding transcriptional LysR family regulator
MRRLKDRSEEYLSIGILNGYYKLLPPSFFSLFMHTNPDISIDIMSLNDDIYQQSMLDYNINIGFVDAPVNENLFEPLLFDRTKIGLAVGKTHRFSKSGSIKPRELKGEQLIILNEHRRLIDFCYRNDIRPRARLSLAELDMVAELCAAGRMACFAGQLGANLAGLNFINIEGNELYFDIYLVANRNMQKSVAVKKFIAYARGQLSNWNPPETLSETE